MGSVQLHWRNYADLIRDTMKLAPALRHVDAIVGIPRSGMLPATILATALHKPLGVVMPLGVVGCAGGARLNLRNTPVSSPRWVLVDDSVLTGASLKRALDEISPGFAISAGHFESGDPPFTACVYCHPDSTDKVDHYAVALPSPRIFEWNLFGAELIKHSLLDIDGVLCPDPPMPEDDRAAYEDYIATAPPMHIPLFPVSGLVTNRLEKYRGVTEQWLALNGIQYRTLRMAPFETPQARRRMSRPADLKSAWYSAHDDPGILVESHDHIAEEVARNVNRPVISVQSMRCFQ